MAVLVSHNKGDGFVVLTLNRPEVYNAFNDEAAADDKTVQVVVITGAGKYFSAGADLKAGQARFSDPNRLPSWRAPVGRFMEAVVRFPKILIAVLNGNAVGVGMTLLAHCDFVFAAQGVVMWTPFARLGLVPEFGSSVLFPAAMGRPLANYVLMGGGKLTAEQAIRAGLVNVVYPPGELRAKSEEFARSLCATPLAEHTLPLFKRMCRPDRAALLALCEEELNELDKRADRGDVLTVFMAKM